MDVNWSIIFIVRDRISVTKILNISHNDNVAVTVHNLFARRGVLQYQPKTLLIIWYRRELFAIFITKNYCKNEKRYLGEIHSVKKLSQWDTYLHLF
jgi:hypothetical protein